MDIDHYPQLAVLSTQHVPRSVDVDRTVLCSPHELIAIVTHTHDVVVYRLNGQVAFTIKNPESSPYDGDDSDLPKTTCLEWSPNGRSLAIAWSDGSWNIYEAEKGEIIFKDTVTSDLDGGSPTHVVNFHWRVHTTVSKSPNASCKNQYRADHSETPDPDLPRAITLHDVTKILPKLSALPSHGLRTGVDGAKFANQPATDAMFGSIDSESRGNEVELLVVQASDGTSRFMLAGTSHVGTIDGRPKDGPCQTLFMPELSTLGTFTQRTSTDIESELLALPLNELDSPLLHGLAHNTSQLNALSLYLQRTVHCVVHDYTAGIAYPERLTKSVSMSMDDREGSSATLPSALVHLALTGQFHPDVLEWLVDIVKDTGLKRWDTSISGMYAAIQTHLHVNIIPALDRASISASRIRGFARLHQGNTHFTPDEALFTDILVKTDTLRSAVREMLQTCVSEWSMWRAFAKWLRMQIEIGTATPGTKSAAEVEERECTAIDIHKVLTYTQTVLSSGSALKSSVLSTSTPQHQTRKDMKPGVHENGLHIQPKTLQSLMTGVHNSILAALHAITEWQGRLFSKPAYCKLNIPDHGHLASLTRIGSPSAKKHTILMAILDKETSEKVTIHSIEEAELPSSTGDSSQPVRLAVSARLDGAIDAKFLQSAQHLVVLRLQAQTSATGDDNNVYELGTCRPRDDGITVVHRFDPTAQFKPARLFVSGREGKEFCVVFDDTFSRWQVLELKVATY